VIIWVFRPTIHPGKEREFEAFLRDTAVPLVSQQAGLVARRSGRTSNPSRAFAGERWQEAVITPDKEHLLTKPIDVNELLDLVNAITAQRTHPVAAPASQPSHRTSLTSHPAALPPPAPSESLAITDEASPFALPSTRNHPRRAMRRGRR
jgi:hypothetical protein